MPVGEKEQLIILPLAGGFHFGLLEWEAVSIITKLGSLTETLPCFVKNSHTAPAFPHEYRELSAKNILNKWLTLTTDMAVVLLDLYSTAFWGSVSYGESLQETFSLLCSFVGFLGAAEALWSPLWKQLQWLQVLIFKSYTISTCNCQKTTK